MMDTETILAEEVQSMYNQCDPEGRGFITRENLNRLQGQLPLSDAQLDEVFDLLDKDKQGRLTLDTFTQGFGQFLGRNTSTFKAAEVEGSDHESDAQLEQALTASGAKILLKDYEQVSRIWKQLRQENPALLPEFEKMLSTIAKELQAAKTEYENMDSIIQTKLSQQEEHLGQLFEELEQEMAQEKERLLEQERAKEKKLRENLAKELRQKENLTTELMHQYEQAQSQLEELESTRMTTVQEKERLMQEKTELEQRLTDTQSALDECKEYIETLQKKAREDRRTRAKAAIELSENIALERENLVRQLDTLRMINRKLVDDREERRQRNLANRNQLVQGLGQTINSHADIRCRRTSSEQSVDFDEDAVGVEEGNVDFLPEWSTFHSKPRTVSNPANPALRRGSILGAYFNAGGPENSSTETELEGIAETEEDEEVFNSDHAQENSGCKPVFGPNGVNQTTPCILDDSIRMRCPDTANLVTEDSLIKGFEGAQRVYKVTFIGNSGVGKSSIIQQLVTNEFDPSISITVAIDFRTKLIQCDGTNVILQLWDTAGQERFKGITKQYFRRADAVVVVFDVTEEATYIAVREWINAVSEGAQDDTIIMILSNKHDKLEPNDEQTELLANSLAHLIQEHGAIGFKVSAKTGYNIQEAFLELTRLLKCKEDARLTNVIQLKETSISTKKGCCR